MYTLYDLKEIRTHKEGFLSMLKRRLTTVYAVFTCRRFVFIKVTDKDDLLSIDITNHDVDTNTTIRALNNYKSILADTVNFSNKVDKKLESWLHTEN